MASLKVETCLKKKKNPPRAQIFRYFCIESRNNKIGRILRHSYECLDNTLRPIIIV